MTQLSVISVFFAGLLSFLSPCVIGIVPIYFAYLSGTTVSEIQAGHHSRKMLFRNVILLICGFTVVFGMLGVAAFGAGRLLILYRPVFDRFLGMALIVFGIIMLELYMPKWLSSRLSLSVKIGQSPWLAFTLGIAFAVMMSGCVSPLLGAVLTLAGSSSTVTQGVGYLMIYSLGIGVPLLLCAVAFNRVMILIKKNAAILQLIKKIAGIIMIIMGIFIVIHGSISLAIF